MSVYDLTGRKALVTGGARGLGAGTAAALTRAGAAVVIGDILEDLGQATADELKKSGASASFLPLDVTNDASWELAISDTIRELAGSRPLTDQVKSGDTEPDKWIDDSNAPPFAAHAADKLSASHAPNGSHWLSQVPKSSTTIFGARATPLESFQPASAAANFVFKSWVNAGHSTAVAGAPPNPIPRGRIVDRGCSCVGCV